MTDSTEKPPEQPPRPSFLDEKQRERVRVADARGVETVLFVVDEILHEIVGPMHRATVETAGERDRAIKRCADHERTIIAMKVTSAFEREAAAHATLDAVNARAELATARKALEAAECVHAKEKKALREAVARHLESEATTRIDLAGGDERTPPPTSEGAGDGERASLLDRFDAHLRDVASIPPPEIATLDHVVRCRACGRRWTVWTATRAQPDGSMSLCGGPSCAVCETTEAACDDVFAFESPAEALGEMAAALTTVRREAAESKAEVDSLRRQLAGTHMARPTEWKIGSGQETCWDCGERCVRDADSPTGWKHRGAE